MPIRKIAINNFRAIEHLEMELPAGQEAGWHVVLGANGSGKTSFLRALAILLMGEGLPFLRIPPREFMRMGADTASVELTLANKEKYQLDMKRYGGSLPSKGYHAFSASFGPFRRFSGGSHEWAKAYEASNPAAPHLSLFGEDVALTEALNWLKELDRVRLKARELGTPDGQVEAEVVFHGTRTFLNESGLLPHKVQMDSIDIDGDPIFRDGQGNLVKVNQLSDGYRSILSLAFEMLRLMVRRHGAKEVFATSPIINIPGVVLIDEVDAHLHPTWQTEIGTWFTRHFPQVQFIVTTHSPLICRAAAKGSIWYLPAPGSGEQFHQVTGQDYDRLVYGNVLDAYGTQVFGQDTARSALGQQKLRTLADLNLKSVMGKLKPEEEQEREELQRIFPTGK